MVSFAAGRLHSSGVVGLSFVRSRRKRFDVEMGCMMELFERGVLVMSFDRVVWNYILPDTLLVITDGGRKDNFGLSPLLNSECRLLFCNQEVRTSMSRDQFVIL